jgi:hypothetical protein
LKRLFRLYKSGNCDDAYETLKWCFTQINERHSFVMSPARRVYNGNINSNSTPARLTGGIRSELLEKYCDLDVPWISTADKNICTAFACQY